MSNGGTVNGEGLGFKTKLVRLGNGLLISVNVLGGFDRMSLFAMIFGFVVIGLLIARRRFTASK